ncbi:MAG: carboxypeptidase regulatory-like domain-containing protein, partial [Anaerolinea sp.]|nr:carboxypeptidase regulatory-like domain-containing protein [Anaerolinea sp.]
MRIEDFPRPPDDNGRGVHWSARLYHDAVYPSLDHWVGQLVAMKIKWVKLIDDGGGSGMTLSRKLVAAGIMPVVRLYMAQLNPSYLSSRELDTVSRYVDQGVRYFESNNEPDLPAEWQNNSRPPNWLEIVVDNFIRDADGVLGRGGLLALPAMGPGSKENPISLVVQKGRRDLFERGCWVAIHNYTLNHPLDYPYDEVNQNGRPLTQEEFDAYARWQYSHLSFQEIQAQGLPVSAEDYGKFNRWAWDGRTMEMVNQVRASNKNPGQTIDDDPNCFKGFLAAGTMMADALGFHVPVISTEGGPVVGWGDDNRYAKMNPTTQMEYQREIVRFMQSQAPPWYFALCTWLLASRPLGDFNPTWEQMSWYTSTWDLQFGLNGQLPTVQALIDEPSLVRPELQPGRGLIQGAVRRADGQPAAHLPLTLTGMNRQQLAASDAAGAFRFERLSAGVYDLSSGEQLLHAGIALESDDAVQTVEVTVTEGRQSSIEGLISDTAGQPQANAAVTVGAGEQQVAAVQAGADGRYRVAGLPAGAYWVNTGDNAAAVAGIRLDGWNSRTVNLTVPTPAGYRYVVVTQRLLPQAETGNDRKFFGRVLDETGAGLNGVTVEMAWTGAAPDTQFPRVVTPRDPFKPAGNFEFLHSPGAFILRVVEAAWPSDETAPLPTANLPGREGEPISYEVNFQRRSSGAAAGAGRLAGVVTNGA